MSAGAYNEAIVFVARETGWTLEYIRSLPLREFNALIRELKYQRDMDNYREAANAAMITAALASLLSKKQYRLDELIGEAPERKEEATNLALKTLPKTIKLADGFEYPLAPVTMNTLAKMEEKIGEDYAKTLEKGSAIAVRHFMFLCLKDGMEARHPGVTEEIVGELLTPDVLAKINVKE